MSYSKFNMYNHVPTGDQPPMTDEEIHDKLEKMKSIPSIFDIQTHAPGESPGRPPTSMPNSMPG